MNLCDNLNDKKKKEKKKENEMGKRGGSQKKGETNAPKVRSSL